MAKRIIKSERDKMMEILVNHLDDLTPEGLCLVAIELLNNYRNTSNKLIELVESNSKTDTLREDLKKWDKYAKEYSATILENDHSKIGESFKNSLKYVYDMIKDCGEHPEPTVYPKEDKDLKIREITLKEVENEFSVL